MECRECELWVQDFLDGQAADLPAHLEVHLGGCAGCRELIGAARGLEFSLQESCRVRPPLDLAGRIVAALAADRRRRLVRRQRWAGMAAAAALLLAPLLTAWFPAADRVAPRGIAAVDELPPAAGRGRDGGPSLRKTAADAGSAVASLTTHLAAKTREQAELLFRAATPPIPISPMDSLPGVETLQPPLEPAARSLQEAGGEVSKGLQTVTDSARRAVAYFVREIPGLEGAGGTVH